jgi:hypothetical protein
MAMITCSVCNETTTREPEPATVETGICNECREKLGIIPMGQPMRPARPCVRCNGMRFTRVIPREYADLPVRSGSQIKEAPHRGAAPMTATVKPTLNPRFFSNTRATAIDVRDGVGVLEMYTCHGCGFVEWYCREPAEIPTGPVYMADIVDYSTKTEYR